MGLLRCGNVKGCRTLERSFEFCSFAGRPFSTCGGVEKIWSAARCVVGAGTSRRGVCFGPSMTVNSSSRQSSRPRHTGSCWLCPWASFAGDWVFVGVCQRHLDLYFWLGMLVDHPV
mmetsp:Transcript_27337/g.58279  ORF Transcript_27337/g.58279 Transcript_27337/m.58279 type:complete len:116 (-) Transcript_27337:279-626(-)